MIDSSFRPSRGRLPRKSDAERLAAQAWSPPPDAERFRWRDAAPALAAVVSVTGSSSNAGKTWVAERTIAWLRGRGRRVTALKVTRTHEGTCPRANDACGTCDSLGGAFEIVDDPRRLAEPRKDTARYVDAGATQVLWLLVRPDAVRRGLLAALARVEPGAVLVVEGNSYRAFGDADLTLMAATDAHEIKPSALGIAGAVDVVLARPEALEAVARWSWGRDPAPEIRSAAEVDAVLDARGPGRGLDADGR